MSPFSADICADGQGYNLTRTSDAVRQISRKEAGQRSRSAPTSLTDFDLLRQSGNQNTAAYVLLVTISSDGDINVPFVYRLCHDLCFSFVCLSTDVDGTRFHRALRKRAYYKLQYLQVTCHNLSAKCKGIYQGGMERYVNYAKETVICS